MAEKSLRSKSQSDLRRTLKNLGIIITSINEKPKYKNINHLYDLSENELNYLMNAAILNKLNKIEENLSSQQYEYAIEVIEDVGGGTNAAKFKIIISLFSY